MFGIYLASRPPHFLEASDALEIQCNFYEYQTIEINRIVVQLIAHLRVVWIGLQLVIIATQTH